MIKTRRHQVREDLRKETDEVLGEHLDKRCLS